MHYFQLFKYKCLLQIVSPVWDFFCVEIFQNKDVQHSILPLNLSDLWDIL